MSIVASSMPLRLRPLLAALALLILGLAAPGAWSPVWAQSPAPVPNAAPLPITPQQFDQLVDALSKAVA